MEPNFIFLKLGRLDKPALKNIPKLPACRVKILNFDSPWPARLLADHEGKITNPAEHRQELNVSVP